LNWKTRIKAALKRNKFNTEDRDLASEWQTCAIGEQLKINSNAKEEKFVDKANNQARVGKAFDLGMYFHYAVKYDEVQKASELYKEIQKVKLKL